MTIKQKQHLLAYLGYYVGKIDGAWGTLSRVATTAFQKDYGLATDGEFGPLTEKKILSVIATGEAPKKEEPVGLNWDEIKYFKRREFACKCGRCGGFPVEPDPELLNVLVKIREHFGKPVHVNSGIRCATHNTNVGGATQSQHLRGTAADITVEGVEPHRVATYAETLLPKTGGIGRYNTFTHVDVRKNRSRWNG
jgi:peptidoglycan hydrolase-like protein with peptidoglycan-binding domain